MILIRQKQFGLFGDIIKGALKGAANEVSSKSQYQQNNNSSNVIFGTLVIDWCVDKSRYIGKNWIYTVNDDYSVEANDGRSHISWDLSEDFEPMDSCPSKWSKFTIKGIAKDGDYLPATIITKTGSEYKGRVLVEVS